MDTPLRIATEWDEVAGQIAGHIEGLPEIQFHGDSLEELGEKVREAVAQMKLLRTQAIIDCHGKKMTLDLAA